MNLPPGLPQGLAGLDVSMPGWPDVNLRCRKSVCIQTGPEPSPEHLSRKR